MATANPDRRLRDRRITARICTCDRAELLVLIKQLLSTIGRLSVLLARFIAGGD
jgi:hypothetical protein